MVANPNKYCVRLPLRPFGCLNKQIEAFSQVSITGCQHDILVSRQSKTGSHFCFGGGRFDMHAMPVAQISPLWANAGLLVGNLGEFPEAFEHQRVGEHNSFDRSGNRANIGFKFVVPDKLWQFMNEADHSKACISQSLREKAGNRGVANRDIGT